MKISDKKLIEVISGGGIGVLPTDTLYGLVGSAFSKEAVERIYAVKKRNLQSPFIVLISSADDLAQFGISLDKKAEKFLQNNWPGKVSVILPCRSQKMQYLHRGTNSLAFRFPLKAELTKLIKKVGPLVAPSANLETAKPAENITEAKKYFGDKVDFYISGRKINQLPSTLAEIKNGKIKILRQGAGKIKQSFKMDK